MNLGVIIRVEVETEAVKDSSIKVKLRDAFSVRLQALRSLKDEVEDFRIERR